MTVFIMRCCKNRNDRPGKDPSTIWRRHFLALLLSLSAVASSAEGITVEKAVLRMEGPSYHAVADFIIKPPLVVEQALAHGVALYFVSEFSLIHPRWYWLNENLALDSQTIKLSYNALTRQYRISFGALYQNFANLEDALSVLRHRSFDARPVAEILPDVRYIAAVRMHLDLDQLPKPLQINALINSDWTLDTGWYQWQVSSGRMLREAAGEGGS